MVGLDVWSLDADGNQSDVDGPTDSQDTQTLLLWLKYSPVCYAITLPTRLGGE